MLSFDTSWNWQNDLLREALRQKHPDLAEIVEDFAPFTSENLNQLVTIVDESDLKAWNQYSEESLLDRYN